MTCRIVPCLSLLLTLAASATPALAGRSVPAPTFRGPAVAEPVFQTSWLAASTQTQSGQVVITEFMKDPSFVADTKGEWIEVWNSLPWRCNLDGWVLSDDSGASHTLSSGGTTALIMRPGERFVLGINGDTAQNGGVNVRYVYSGFSLANSGADQIQLSKPDGTLVDRVEFDAVNYPHTPGRSIQLDESWRDVYANDDAGHWCHSQSNWNASNPDTGTPGLPNDPCQ